MQVIRVNVAYWSYQCHSNKMYLSYLSYRQCSFPPFPRHHLYWCTGVTLKIFDPFAYLYLYICIFTTVYCIFRTFHTTRLLLEFTMRAIMQHSLWYPSNTRDRWPGCIYGKLTVFQALGLVQRGVGPVKWNNIAVPLLELVSLGCSHHACRPPHSFPRSLVTHLYTYDKRLIDFNTVDELMDLKIPAAITEYVSKGINETFKFICRTYVNMLTLFSKLFILWLC